MRSIQPGLRRRTAITRKSGLAYPCKGGDDSGGEIDPTDPVIALIRDEQGSGTIEGYIVGTIELSASGGAAVTVEALLAGACNSGDDAVAGDAPHAIVVHVRNVQVTG